MALITVDGTGFLVLRAEDDEAILVAPPSCPHMSAPLCDGFFDGSLLTCSKHLWQWSMPDGSMHGVAEAPLAIYPSRETDGVIYIYFERELRYRYEDEAELKPEASSDASIPPRLEPYK